VNSSVNEDPYGLIDFEYMPEELRVICNDIMSKVKTAVEASICLYFPIQNYYKKYPEELRKKELYDKVQRDNKYLYKKLGDVPANDTTRRKLLDDAYYNGDLK
jgi:hypothetical protein